MPWPGIPEEKESEMESCIAQVMEKHKGEKDFDKSNAIAICHDSITGSTGTTSAEVEFLTVDGTPTVASETASTNPSGSYTTIRLDGGWTPVTPDDIATWGNPLIAADADGDLLKNSGVVLAHAERNANGDGITVQNIAELAATLNLKPLDIEHKQEQIVGFFVNPRQRAWTKPDGTAVEGGELATDVVIFSKRFPKVVTELRDGTRRPSIEAVSSAAQCSVCNQWFASSKDYCEHLLPFTLGGAVAPPTTRYHKNMRAVGGGAVLNPAAKQARFGADFMVIAHEVELTVREENTMELEELQAQLNALQVHASELEADKARLEQQLAEHTAMAAAVVTKSRVATLNASGMPEDRIKTVEPHLAEMTDEVFDMLAGLQRDLAQSAREMVQPPAVSTPPITSASVHVGDAPDVTPPKDPFAAFGPIKEQ